MPWWERADCLGEDRLDPTLPDLGQAERRRIARWYCIECEVRPECARDALRNGDVDHIRAGIWTGSSARGYQLPRVRDRLRRIEHGGTTP